MSKLQKGLGERMNKIISVILLIMGIILIMCNVKDLEVQQSYASNDRFILVSEQYIRGDSFEVYYDINTKVMYLVIDIYKGGGITVLVDADGKPLLYGGGI